MNVVVDTNVVAYYWLPGVHTEHAVALRRTTDDWFVPKLCRSELRFVGVREEVVLQYSRKRRSRRFEAGGEEVAKGVGDLGRDDGRGHEGISGPEPFGAPPSLNPEVSMPFLSTMSWNSESGVPGLPQPRRDVPLAAKHPPDIDVIVALDEKHQIRESSQRPESQSRQVQLMRVAR